MRCLVFISLCLWSVSAFSTVPSIGNDVEAVYSGKGAIRYAAATDEEIPYSVTMKKKDLGDSGDTLLEYRFVEEKEKKKSYQSLIIKGDNSFRVLIPASKDSHDDYSSYKEAGWAFEIEHESDDASVPKRIFLMLNYTDLDNNTVMGTISVEKGKDLLVSTWSVGNTTGLIKVWKHKMTKQ